MLALGAFKISATEWGEFERLFRRIRRPTYHAHPRGLPGARLRTHAWCTVRRYCRHSLAARFTRQMSVL